jgi:uncharacterized protein (DUF2236 family)
MTEPVSFTSTTPRHALPFLFAGQAQKEFVLNQCLAQIDLLMHPAVQGEQTDPPPAPIEGECWLVGANATAAWAGMDAAIASWHGDQWQFAQPLSEMRVFDRDAGGWRRYSEGWQRLARPADPAGGATIDSEARAAIVAILSALQQYGLFSAS